jgi:hypothetical protein
VWDSESQRIGKQKCTPLGYRLHLVSDLVGFVALILLLVTFVYLRFRSVLGSFHESLWWLLAVPVAMAFGGTLLHRYSWLLAERKGFRYDDKTCEASWLENGQQTVVKWPAAQETRVE